MPRTLVLPAELHVRSLLQATAVALGPGAWPEVIDVRSLQFIQPSGLASLAAILDGADVAKIKWIGTESSRAWPYLVGMGLFDALGVQGQDPHAGVILENNAFARLTAIDWTSNSTVRARAKFTPQFSLKSPI